MSFDRTTDPTHDPERRFNESVRPEPKEDLKQMKKEIAALRKKNRDTDPQPQPKGKGPEIAPLVINDIKERVAKGIETYGEPLKAQNGRNPLIDAYQEALDLVMYLKQALVERFGRNLIEENRQADRAFNEMKEPAIEACAIAPRYEWGEDALDLKIDPIYCPVSPADLAMDLYPLRAGRVISVDGPQPNILHEAHNLVHGERGKHYGHPIFDLTRTADIATAVLRTKLVPGTRLEAEDIAKMQIGTKLSRETFKPKHDNRVDICGYAEVLDMIVQWRKEHEGADPRDHYGDEAL